MTVISVVKRSTSSQRLERQKLLTRVRAHTFGLDTRYVDAESTVDTVIQGSYDGILTQQLDELCAQTAAYRSTQHPDYALLAGRLAVTNLYKTTSPSFLEAMCLLHDYVTPHSHESRPLISEQVWEVLQRHGAELEGAIRGERDLNYEYFGFKTLERSYLLWIERDGKRDIIERPQYMLMRVSIGIYGFDIPTVLKSYNYLSEGLFTHATPTLFNAGTPNPQMSSCFLLAMKKDSIEGIFDTLTDCAVITKFAGGVGLHVHNIRGNGSYIQGTNGHSTGLVSMLRMFNNTSRYVDQGGGKRKGAIAIYLEPWHSDIIEFLELKRNTGKDELRARDLFYALWIPDLFMKRVEEKKHWTLFDPSTAPNLPMYWGKEFENLYERYEAEGRGQKVISAQDLWFQILESQIETGTPYMLYKDTCNRKSNQQHLGTIQCSNLCTEIIEFTSPEETAVCNLASIALPKFVRPSEGGGGTFDFEHLREIAGFLTRALNRVIDKNMYPVEEARRSNLRHRPIGIGVQGLADTFLLLRLPYASEKAKKLNEEIFETIYFGASETSCALAKAEGPYPSFEGSPLSEGRFQFDLWGITPSSGRWDWDLLRQDILKYGARNSLLLAPMPTASTSQILGNNECIEPFTSNIYLRRVLSGEFPIINKYLVRDLITLGLWSESTREHIIAMNGSVQHLPKLPDEYKEMYRTVWEIKQRELLDMAVTRGAYICQSQSLNVFLESPTCAKLTSMHFYAWRKGLKTGMYYLRSRPSVDAIKFTIDPTLAYSCAAKIESTKKNAQEEEKKQSTTEKTYESKESQQSTTEAK